MSNKKQKKKRKNANQKRISASKIEFDKKRFYENIKEEINGLQNELERIKKNNSRNKKIKNIRIFLASCRLILPYGVAFFIPTFAAYNAFPLKPFSSNYVEVPAKVVTTYDKSGVISTSRNWEHEPDLSKSYVEYCGKWEKISDNYYARSVRKYYCEVDSLEELETIFEMSDDIETKFKKMFGKPIEFIESRQSLTDEEFLEDSHIIVTISSTDNKDFKVKKALMEQDVAVDLIYLLVLVLFESVVFIFRCSSYGYVYDRDINNINNKYQIEDIENIKAKLKIREDNYKRIMG